MVQACRSALRLPAVEEAVEAGGGVAADGELLEDADALVLADATRRRRAHERLDVHVLGGVRVVDGQVPALAADLQLALPDAVAPLRWP